MTLRRPSDRRTGIGPESPDTRHQKPGDPPPGNRAAPRGVGVSMTVADLPTAAPSITGAEPAPGAALLVEVWGPGYADDTQVLRTHIANLRRKIEEDPKTPRYIKTVWGGGYSFAVEVRKL